jgi:hypothetical protein
LPDQPAILPDQLASSSHWSRPGSGNITCSTSQTRWMRSNITWIRMGFIRAISSPSSAVAQGAGPSGGVAHQAWTGPGSLTSRRDRQANSRTPAPSSSRRMEAGPETTSPSRVDLERRDRSLDQGWCAHCDDQSLFSKRMPDLRLIIVLYSCGRHASVAPLRAPSAHVDAGQGDAAHVEVGRGDAPGHGASDVEPDCFPRCHHSPGHPRGSRVQRKQLGRSGRMHHRAQIRPARRQPLVLSHRSHHRSQMLVSYGVGARDGARHGGAFATHVGAIDPQSDRAAHQAASQRIRASGTVP